MQKEVIKMKDIKFYIDYDQKTTICIFKTNRREEFGITKCHPKDTWNDYRGMKEAFTHAVSKIPSEQTRLEAWKKFHIKYPIPKKENKLRKYGT